MDRTERFYKIERLIRSRGSVSFAVLLDELAVSRATLKRDLEYLRDRLGAPIEYDRMSNGYRFATETRDARHELPGLWFDQRELYALMMAHQLLSELDADGMLSRHLQPLRDRIDQMLGSGDDGDAQALMKRVKIIGAARRPVPSGAFERVGEALWQRRRLRMRYHTRGRGEVSEREVSPQRLVHYRNTWYLDAWCHTRERLLRFALDAVQQAEVLEARAKSVPLKQLQSEMDAGYGIYAGGTRRWAVLRFSARIAPWVSQEQWHADQQGRLLPDGSWELKLPYVDDTELVMDVLRHAGDVQVVSPAALGAAVRERLQKALAQQQAVAMGG